MWFTYPSLHPSFIVLVLINVNGLCWSTSSSIIFSSFLCGLQPLNTISISVAIVRLAFSRCHAQNIPTATSTRKMVLLEDSSLSCCPQGCLLGALSLHACPYCQWVCLHACVWLFFPGLASVVFSYVLYFFGFTWPLSWRGSNNNNSNNSWYGIPFCSHISCDPQCSLVFVSLRFACFLCVSCAFTCFTSTCSLLPPV